MRNKSPALNPLNKRVWSLFARAGFETRPNANNLTEEQVDLGGGSKRTLDLLASANELGARIIGWNKGGKDLKESLTTHIHDYLHLKKITAANGVLFVTTSKEVSDENRNYAKAQGVTVWGEEELRYYEVVVDAIGEHAKYEIIHSFGIRTKEEAIVHHTLALMFSQPFGDSPTTLFQFTMPPEKLLKTCVIYRKAQGSAAAYQRMLRRDRLHRIRDFVARRDALLPTNIIVHLSDEVSWDPIDVPQKDSQGKPTALAHKASYELVVLKIPLAYASMELIDGQHRLYGFVQTEPATRKEFNLVPLGIAGLSTDKKRDTFVAINDNSRRMDPNLVAFLKFTSDEAECQRDNALMAIRIVVELNRTTPFKGKIKLLDVGDQRITLKGFSGYDLKGLLGSSRGLLRKYYPNESPEYISALRLYFGLLKSMFPKQWNAPDRYIMFTNRGVSAFVKLLKSMLVTCKRRLTKDDVQKYLGPLKTRWKDGDWETKRLKSAYVGSKGWKDFHRDLVRTIRKDYRDFKE